MWQFTKKKKTEILYQQNFCRHAKYQLIQGRSLIMSQRAGAESLGQKHWDIAKYVLIKCCCGRRCRCQS